MTEWVDISYSMVDVWADVDNCQSMWEWKQKTRVRNRQVRMIRSGVLDERCRRSVRISDPEGSDDK